MAKRVSIADREKKREAERGIKAYTGTLGQQPTAAPVPTPKKRKDILVKLSEDVVAWRDKIWRERLAVDSKAEKSHIVEEALREYQKKLEAEGDPFLTR
jgi:hypothetical protein